MESSTTRASADRDQLYDIALIPAAVALNVAVAVTVSMLKLPVYIDGLGTISIVLMGRRSGFSAMWAGVFVGVFSFVLIALFVNPTIIWFSHVQAALAVYAFFVIRPIVRRMESEETQSQKFRNWLMVIFSGIGLGLVAAALSAPVAAFLFSGITPNGPGAVVALLIASGQSLFKAVITGGFSIEPIDKSIQVLLAVFIYFASPWRRQPKFKEGQS
jgi:energy-coupling factor transport system substrate-specific component